MPGEVASLQFDEISDRYVNVIWSPPKDPNGVLTSYQITYHVRDKPETVKMLNLSSDTLNIGINDLQAMTHYRFEVRNNQNT